MWGSPAHLAWQRGADMICKSRIQSLPTDWTECAAEAVTRYASEIECARLVWMFAHLHVALLIQLCGIGLGLALGVPLHQGAWLGCFAACAVCIAREVTQHEYRWIEHKGGGLRANMPWYAGYRFWRWNAHSKQETVVAIIAPVVVALGVNLIVR